MIGMMEDNFVTQKFLQLFDGSGSESIFVLEMEVVVVPLCGEKRVSVVG